MSCADFAEVGGRVGQMGLETFRGEGAADVAIHGDIGERAVGRLATTTCKDVIETRATEVLEAATVEVDVLSVA